MNCHYLNAKLVNFDLIEQLPINENDLTMIIIDIMKLGNYDEGVIINIMSLMTTLMQNICEFTTQ